MTKFELYVRVLTELHQGRFARSDMAPILIARSRLQDVLCELRDMAAAERGRVAYQPMEQVRERIQNEAETEAMRRVLAAERATVLRERSADSPAPGAE